MRIQYSCLCVFLLSLSIFFACVYSNSDIKPPDLDREITFSMSSGIGNHHSNFEKLGFQKGDCVPDFTLFSLEGAKVKLSEIVRNHKPVLLISGSYTCDITRHNLPDINVLTQKYKDVLNIFMVYTIDAHPVDGISPYSDNHKIEISTVNIREHIQANQPKTYGERKVLAQKMQSENYIIAPILIDDPDNNFWKNFGQAPNFAYLIEPDQSVFYRQTWFKFREINEAIKSTLYQ